MERSYKNLEPGSPASIESLFKGVEHLHTSYGQDGVSKYQFPTFFSNALRYIEANKGRIPEGLADEIEAWFSMARQHMNHGDREFDRKIDNYRRIWLRAQFPESNTKRHNRTKNDHQVHNNGRHRIRKRHV